jgi:hypothetical protein
MDEAKLGNYIMDKSNGRNLEGMLILKSVLVHQTVTKKRALRDVKSFVRSNQERLPGSYSKSSKRRNEYFLEDRFGRALAKLEGDNVVSVEGKKKKLVALSDPIESPGRTELAKRCLSEILKIIKMDDAAETEKSGVDSSVSDTITELAEIGLEKIDGGVPAASADASLDSALREDLKRAGKNVKEKLGDIDLHGGWKPGDPPTYEMLIASLLEHFEVTVRRFVKSVFAGQGDWMRQKVEKDTRDRIHPMMVEKRERAKRRGEKITLDHVDEFLNSTDFGSLIQIIFHNQKEFAIAFDDKGLVEIKPLLLGIKGVRDPRAHADQTYAVDKNTYNIAVSLVGEVLVRIEAYNRRD